MDTHRVRQLLIALVWVLLTPSLVTSAAALAGAGPPISHLAESTVDTGAVVVAGSATVGPILEAASEAYAAERPEAEVAVERISSGAGIKRFCNGETDLAPSGRRIKTDEAAACAAAGVAYDAYEVAFDGIAVVLNPANDAVSCLTVDQLGRLWQPGSTLDTWRDLDPTWSDRPIALLGAGSESGTYQFFTQAVVGEEGASRDDYAITDGHPDTAARVAADPNGLGFLPFPRYAEHRDELRLAAVDGGDGCVAPSPETIRDGSYAPLSRPLYVYAKRESLDRPEVATFLRFYLADAGEFATAAGLVASPTDVYAANMAMLEETIAGPADSRVFAEPDLRTSGPR